MARGYSRRPGKSRPIFRRRYRLPLSPIRPFPLSASGGVTSTPATGSLTLTGYAPTVTTPRAVVPATKTLTLTGYAPTISTPRAVVPATATLTTTAYAPAVLAPRSVVPATASLTITGFAPTVTTPRAVVPGTASLTITGYAPTVSTPAAVIPDTATLTTTGYPPNVTAPRVVVPDAATLTLTGFAPDVSVVAGVIVVPATGSLTLTGYPPDVAAPRAVTPGTATLTLTGTRIEIDIAPVSDQRMRGVPGVPRKRRIGVREGRSRGLVPTFGASLLVGEAAIASALDVAVEGTGSLILDTRYDIGTTAVAVLAGEFATQAVLPFAVQSHGRILGSAVRGLSAGRIRAGATAILAGEALGRGTSVFRPTLLHQQLAGEGRMSSSIAVWTRERSQIRTERTISGRLPIRSGGEAAATACEDDEQVTLFLLGLPSEIGA